MEEKPASEQIDDIIAMHAGWKGDILARLRECIVKADPDLTEEIKWRMALRPEGLPIWSHEGILCFAETWKDNVKLLFPKGAQLKDPAGIFNARLQSKDIRAIEFREGDSVNSAALKELVREALRLNLSK